MTKQRSPHKPRRANRLAGEKSPYLLQHAGNPVDWYPWGEDAFLRAEEEDKPVFLSIGYSSCHWCHVMAEESFEDDEVAELLNRDFVCVKVDREERPDIDATYMTAAQLIAGGGGWPLTLFLTPQKKPFYAATYLPKETKHGMVGLTTVLPAIIQFWKERRSEISETSERIMEALRSVTAVPAGSDIGIETFVEAYETLEAAYDYRYGGFGTAPKFPTPHRLTFLLRYWKRTSEPKALEIVQGTLGQMRRGGIHDQIGGGFHRYSTDQAWTVPHFEKMLYDQALLAMAYVEAWQATGDPEFEETARGIIDYVLEQMTSPEGGFFSAEDADSEGEEGKYYVWTEEELREILSPEELISVEAYFGVTEEGNFQEGSGRPVGKNVLQIKGEASAAIGPAVAKMLDRRAERVPPFKDDKIMADWNGLMIAALAKAYGAWRDPRHGDAARRASSFVLEHMRDGGGLHHIYRGGISSGPTFLSDHAFMSWGLLELFTADPQPRWLEEAITLVGTMREKFEDEQGFFQTEADGEEALPRTKESYDGAIPSGNSVALLALLLLHKITGQDELMRAAERTVAGLSTAVFRSPHDHAQFLNAVDLMLGPSSEVVLSGTAEDIEHFMAELGKAFSPNKVVVHASGDARMEDLSPLVNGRSSGEPLAYICTGRTCLPPVRDPKGLTSLMSER